MNIRNDGLLKIGIKKGTVMSNHEIIHEFADEQETGLTIKPTVIDTLEGGLIVYLSGYITTYNADYFQKQVVQSIKAGYTKLIFQCRELTYLSATGIGSFSWIFKLVKSQGGDIVFCDLQPKVYDVFQVLGFTEVFIIKSTVDASMQVFHSGASEEAHRPYPQTFTCPVCASPLQAEHPSYFQCAGYKSILARDKQGQVFLG
jgi:anti-anti-sigma factor